MNAAAAAGAGPWFCSLLFNTSVKCKKQTHLVAHTAPHLAVDALNRSRKRPRKSTGDEVANDFWVMICKVGPFDVWADAMTYLDMWTTKTRGKNKRWERGLELFEMYGKAHNLHLWVQSVPLHQQETAPPPIGTGRVVIPLLQEESTMVPLQDALNQLCSYLADDVILVGDIKATHAKLNNKKRAL
jgi:hypothetical protein